MATTLTIARREFNSYFFSPIAYVVMALFVLLASVMFLVTTFDAGAPASLRQTFFWMVWILVAIVPAISMRLVSEELRSGNIETLMTSPITDSELIVGKWLGGLGFFAMLLVPTLAFVVMLAIWSAPDYGPIFTEYLGLLLVGGLYMAVGTFASVITRNQIIAYIITMFTILLLTVVTYFLPAKLPTSVAPALFYINVNEQFDTFNKGVIDFSNFAYFISGISLFLVLAIVMLNSRKWR